MKIFLPGGITKTIKPTACNPVEENGQIKFCLVLDPMLTMAEARLITEELAKKNEVLGADNTDEIADNNDLIQKLNAVLNP